jgi:prephenate dehydrogenase
MNLPLWNRVTIVGCGLIGSSFALALKRNHLCTRLAGWDSSEAVLAEAIHKGVIDEIDYSLADGGVSESDLIYLALPVNAIISFIRENSRAIKRGALITDSGSTKQEIMRAAREHLSNKCHFVSGHPIAGSHLSGLEHACDDLFAGNPYILVPAFAHDGDAVFTRLKETVVRCGARVVTMTAAEHDRAMALVSHLPQLLSSILASTIRSRADGKELLDVSGTGYADMTRLAGSRWSIWRDILLTNRVEIDGALGEFINELKLVRDELNPANQNGDSELSHTRSLFEDLTEQEEQPDRRS